MDVVFEEIDGVAVERMVVAECEDHHVGEVVGYRCQECGMADESLDQIWHQEDCSLAGEHGRQHYESLEAGPDAGRPAEFDVDADLWVVTSAETDASDDVYNGTVVAFKCECGNADENLFEIVHDEACPLADDNCEVGLTDPAAISDLPRV